MSATNPPIPPSHSPPTGDRRHELERIKAAVWPPNESQEAREERICRNLAALASLPKWEFPVELDADTWKWIAESPDVYDED